MHFGSDLHTLMSALVPHPPALSFISNGFFDWQVAQNEEEDDSESGISILEEEENMILRQEKTS